MIAIKSEL